VYAHVVDVRGFLEDWPEKNKLLKSVDFDVREKLYIAGCRYSKFGKVFSSSYSTYCIFRAMGLLYVLVMLPFEDRLRRGSILELNDDLELLHSTVENWSRDGTLPLSRKEPVFELGKPMTSPLLE
jgi:hypothetical protein